MSLLQHFCSYQSSGFEICCLSWVDLDIANSYLARTVTMQEAEYVYALVPVQFST